MYQNETTKTLNEKVIDCEEDDDNDHNVNAAVIKMRPNNLNILSLNSLFQQITQNTAEKITEMSDFEELINQESESIINLIGNEQFTAKILNSWQIRVRIVKLKYLLGIKENTSLYVKVNIGEDEFCTQIKQVNDLIFTEVFIKFELKTTIKIKLLFSFEIFTYRLTNIKSIDALNRLIKISIFYRKNYMIGLGYNRFGSFTVDVGTVYKQKSLCTMIIIDFI